MDSFKTEDHFTPVSLSKNVVPGSMTRVILNGEPIVLIRHENTVHAYHDFCPHRGAPLSLGKIKDAQIHCPYHGWAFDQATGVNTSVPVKNGRIACSLEAVFVREKYGVVWLSKKADAQLPAAAEFKPHIHFSGSIEAQLANVLENFLEGSHTHYIHDGLVRTQNSGRSEFKARFVPKQDGFEVHYAAEKQKGLVTRLAPKRFQELTTRAKFVYPYTAILEFYDHDMALTAEFRAFLKPNNANVEYFAVIFLNLGALTPFATGLARLLFRKIVDQDKAILEIQQANLRLNRDRPFVSDDTTDLVGKQIFAWLHHPAQILREERTMGLHL